MNRHPHHGSNTPPLRQKRSSKCHRTNNTSAFDAATQSSNLPCRRQPEKPWTAMIWVGRGLQEWQSFRRQSSGSISHSPTPHHLAHNTPCLQETPGETNASPPNNRNKFLNSACRWQLVSQKCRRYLSNNIANDEKSIMSISAFLCQSLYDQPFYTVRIVASS
jgi:hypothetical protein